MTKCKSTQDS